MKRMVECLDGWIKEEGGRGPDYVQARTGHALRSFSHGMTVNSSRVIPARMGQKSKDILHHRYSESKHLKKVRGAWSDAARDDPTRNKDRNHHAS